MQLIIGLGNPGEKYIKTRHNIGFLTVEELQKKETDFSDWRFNKKFNSFLSTGSIDDEKIILVKPQTFMNNSGIAVRALKDFYKIEIKDILVFHDDIDIPLGEFKVQVDRGPAGHNGIKSMIKELRSKNFARVRVGINPKIKNGVSELKSPSEKFVLKNFTKKEEGIIQEIIKNILNKKTIHFSTYQR
ncbi:aminoacyl-tRNA hydrolase [Candidatus Falkowbacteria bacterium]|jgi:peptidyl-tRNA hydrolase, PTH1 family|nr:aminoacyl-tRNA hydrolase [Candidatus Falkowbacteria bacterium]MBT4433025.1 aminoacyl-tRNA hydrolase [Candidatus Falkowbacteria bacterium]